MGKIHLGGRTIESYYGRNIDIMPSLLARYEKDEGIILPEAEIRLLGVINFKNAPQITNNYWDTSTLLAIKKESIKVILPYEAESRKLTEPAKFGLGLINPNEELINHGVNLDIDERWERLDGRGVYTLQRKELILNKDLIEEQAMKHKLLLTKLGHPDYVDRKFARSADEVAEIIGKTFELGKKEYNYNTMMGQYLPDVSDKGIMKIFCVGKLDDGARSSARTHLDDDDGRFAFDNLDLLNRAFFLFGEDSIYF